MRWSRHSNLACSLPSEATMWRGDKGTRPGHNPQGSQSGGGTLACSPYGEAWIWACSYIKRRYHCSALRAIYRRAEGNRIEVVGVDTDTEGSLSSIWGWRCSLSSWGWASIYMGNRRPFFLPCLGLWSQELVSLENLRDFTILPSCPSSRSPPLS